MNKHNITTATTAGYSYEMKVRLLSSLDTKTKHFHFYNLCILTRKEHCENFYIKHHICFPEEIPECSYAENLVNIKEASCKINKQIGKELCFGHLKTCRAGTLKEINTVVESSMKRHIFQFLTSLYIWLLIQTNQWRKIIDFCALVAFPFYQRLAKFSVWTSVLSAQVKKYGVPQPYKSPHSSATHGKQITDSKRMGRGFKINFQIKGSVSLTVIPCKGFGF